MVDENYEMNAPEETEKPNIDTMYTAPPESTKEAMLEAGIL